MPTTQERGLTTPELPAILPNNGPVYSTEDLVGIQMSKLRELQMERRAALIKEVIAIENFLGISSRECKHCGKSVR